VPLERPRLAWILDLLVQAVTSAGLRVAANLLAFLKALLTDDGVLADITSKFQTDNALIACVRPRLAAA
jgi:hypothetical protein